MGRVRFTAEQIIGKLREAEVLLGQGLSIGEAIRRLGVSEQTYYRWRKEYGGMRVDHAKRLKKLEARTVIKAWRHDYNRHRPHSALGYRLLAPEAFEPRFLTLQVVQ